MPADLAGVQPVPGVKILSSNRRNSEAMNMAQEIPAGFFAKNIDPSAITI